jgi:hypothetical protein
MDRLVLCTACEYIVSECICQGNDVARKAQGPAQKAAAAKKPRAVVVPIVALDEGAVAVEKLKTPVCGTLLPPPIARMFHESARMYSRRWIIVDNSGSMGIHDGNKTDARGRSVACTRWDELRQTLLFHGEVAQRLKAPTAFRFLNRPSSCGGAEQYITVGDPAERSGLSQLKISLNTSPTGGTPLCKHLRAVAAELRRWQPEMDACGQRGLVIIATDGQSSDGDLAAALKPFERLPCSVVVRLCTDEESTVQYWNDVDDDLELELDVLDDLKGEAAECHFHNPWLTYSLPLHRIREWGAPGKLFDLIDERPFRGPELARFADALLGCGPGPRARALALALGRPGGESLARCLEEKGPDDFGAALGSVLLDVVPVADPLRQNALRPLIDAALAIRVAKGESVTGGQSLLGGRAMGALVGNGSRQSNMYIIVMSLFAFYLLRLFVFD